MAQTNWNSLGTRVPRTDFLFVGRNADGRLEVFVGSRNSELWHIWQTSPGSTWSTWGSLNKPPNTSYISSAAVGQNADGRLEVFTVGADGALWHIWQTAPNGTWSTWDSLGKPSNVDLSFPAVGKNADERIEVFTVGTDGALWHIWQTAADGPWYHTWFSSGKPSASTVSEIIPVVSQDADGRLEIFTLAGGILWHIWQTAPNGTWSAWNTLNQPSYVQFTTRPTVGKNKDGRLEPLIISYDGALWHLWQTSPGGPWSAWDSLGAPPNVGFYTPVVSENADGRLEVFAPNDAASENGLWHTWQVTPGGSWG